MDNSIDKIKKDSEPNEELTAYVNSEDFVLKKEDRNLIRKILLKVLKNTLILKFALEESSEEKIRILEFEVKKEEMAKQIKVDDYAIPVFGGGNYTSWKFRIKNILKTKKCYDLATRVKTDSESQAA